MTEDGKTEQEETEGSMLMVGLAVLAMVFFFGACVGRLIP